MSVTGRNKQKLSSYTLMQNSNRKWGRVAIAAAALGMGGFSNSASAAVLTWDILHNHVGSDGSGTWDNSTANWATGSADTVFTNGSTAVFGSGGTAGTVTVAAVTVGGITFNNLTGANNAYNISGGTITVNSSSTIADNNTAATTIINSAVIEAVGNASITVTGAGNLSFGGQVGTSGSNNPQLIMNGTGILTIGAGSGSDNIAAGITANSGTVILNKASTNGVHAIGGGVTVAGGLLQLAGTGNDQIFDGDAVAVTSGALDLNGTSETFANTGGALFTLGGTGIGNAGALVNSSATAATLYVGDGTTLIANASIGVTQAASSLTMGNNITGNYNLNKVGSGTLILTGNNSYGSTTITSGTVLINNDNNLGTTNGTPLTFNGGTLANTAGNFITDTHVITVGANGGTIKVASQSTNNQIYFHTTNTLIGSGPLSVIGGTFRSDVAQSYSGVMTLSASGEFEYNGANAVSSGASFVVNGNGDGTQANGELIASSGLTVSNAITANGGLLTFDNGTAGIYSGPITLNGLGVTVGLRNFYSTGQVTGGTISGAIGGSGPLTVNSGTGNGGILTVSGTNTYTGNTTVNSAFLKAGAASVANVSGAFGNNSAVTLANATNTGLDITGFNTQIGSLTGGGSNGGNVTLGAATLSVGGNNTSPAAYAGVISGTGGLTKIGTGTQSLSAANSYSGATSITNGLLNITGSLAGGSAVTVGSATAGLAPTLAGTGTVNGPITLSAAGSGSGGVFSPGNGGAAVGSLTAANTFTLNTGSVLNYDFGTKGTSNASPSTTTDRGVLTASANGSLVFPASGVTLSLTSGSANFTGSGAYELFSYANAATPSSFVSGFTGGTRTGNGADGSVTLANFPTGFSYTLTNDTANKGIFLDFSPAVSANTIISLLSASAGAPTTYGGSVGAFTVTGSSSAGYVPVSEVVSPTINKGYTQVTFNAQPTSGTEVYALQLSSSANDAQLIIDINAQSGTDGVTASLVSASTLYASDFPGYDILLTASSGNALNASSYLGFDFSGDTNANGITVTNIAAVPEPATIAGLVLGVTGVMLGRRKDRVA